MSTQTHGPRSEDIPAIGLHRTVAANVRAEMARQDATQERLAALLGKSQQLISNRLKGKTPFTIDELGLVANELGVDLPDLFRARKNPRPVGPDGGDVCAVRDSNPEPAGVKELCSVLAFPSIDSSGSQREAA